MRLVDGDHAAPRIGGDGLPRRFQHGRDLHRPW
jgi:hypothetical protein